MAGLAKLKDGRAVYEPDGAVLAEAFWDEHRFMCIQGPIGSGTSSMSCHRIWRLACQQEPGVDGVRRTRWLVVRTTYKELKETTVKTWLQWFPEDQWGPFIRAEPMFHHLKKPHPSGDGTRVDCEVIFVAVPDAETAEAICASYEITGFFVNEGQFTDKGVIDELLSRTGRYPSLKDGAGASWFGGWMDMNAPVEGHWVPYMRGDLEVPAAYTDEQKAELEVPRDGDGEPQWIFYVQPPGLIETKVEGKTVYLENPNAENQKWLVEPYLEKIKGKKKSWIDRRVMNRVGLHVEGASVYPTFSEFEHVLKVDAKPRGDLHIIVGLDFGRDPAAVFTQNVSASWTALAELVGQNESAALFAPRVKRMMAQLFPSHDLLAYGDPRGADHTQSDEGTAYDVFQSHGIRVMPATTDNNVQLRRSTMEEALSRSYGLRINPSCLVLKRGLAGGYHYPQLKVRGLSGLYSENPRKNEYSHVVEALENALLGGGQSRGPVSRPPGQRAKPSKITRRRVRMGG